jgi:hypothetical protein
MRSKVFISVLVALAMLLSFGATVKDAKADALLFPWIVKSDTVTTLISVVNTSQSISEACGLVGPFITPGTLHWEYFYKATNANGQTETCLEHNFESTTSKDDMVTFDVDGVFHSGLALFNDFGSDPIFVADFTLPVENPRRAFLLVDNNTNVYVSHETNDDGTLYGEAMIIERGSGAAWGYIAYNGRGGVKVTEGDDNLCFADDDHRDMLGEVIGDWDPFDNCEMAPVTILPPDLVQTRFFITPTASNNDDGDNCDDCNQRRGTENAIVQLCASPGPDSEWPDCDCPPGGGGIWNNTEGKISFTVRKNIVCTSADDLEALMGTTAYNSFRSSGKAGWTYVDADRGTMNAPLDNAPFCETDEFVIGKLEYAEGDTIFDGAYITDPPAGVDMADLYVNNFVWLRNNRSYIGYCTHGGNWTNWRCDDEGGLNLVHNEWAECPF